MLRLASNWETAQQSARCSLKRYNHVPRPWCLPFFVFIFSLPFSFPYPSLLFSLPFSKFIENGSVRDSLLAIASWVTFTIAAYHFLLVQNSNWANGPSRTARKVIFWGAFIIYGCILFVAVQWNRDVRRLLRFQIPEPIIVYFGFVSGILLSVAFPEQTLLDIVICSLLAYSLFSLIELVQRPISFGMLTRVLSILLYKVYRTTDTLRPWRVIYGFQCIMLPLWFWNVKRTKRDDGTEDTTGTGPDNDGGGNRIIDVDESERTPTPVPPAIQATGRSTVDDDGRDEITVVDPTNEGIVLPLHESGSAETGAQTPEIGKQELQAIILDGQQGDVVINVRIGVLRNVVKEMIDDVVKEMIDANERDAAGGEVERDVAGGEVERDAAGDEVERDAAGGEVERDVAAEDVRDVAGGEVERDVVGGEVERDVAAEDVRDVAGGEVERDVASDEVVRDVAIEDVRDVAPKDVRDNANVAEVIFRDVCNIGAELLRDAISVAMAVSTDVYGLIIAEVASDAIIAEAVTRYVMTDLSIQIPEIPEDVRDVAAEDVRDNANVAEVIFRDVCNITAELMRDVVAQEDMRDAISVAMAVFPDVYGLIIAEVARDATIAEAVTRYVMTDLSIQIPDEEGMVPPLQEDQKTK